MVYEHTYIPLRSATLVHPCTCTVRIILYYYGDVTAWFLELYIIKTRTVSLEQQRQQLKRQQNENNAGDKSTTSPLLIN